MYFRLLSALAAAVLLFCAPVASGISPAADRWQFCATGQSGNQCFDSIEKAEGYIRQEPASGATGRRFLERNGHMEQQGPLLNPSWIRYDYAVKPQPPVAFHENYVRAQRIENLPGGTDCGCVGGVDPICWEHGVNYTCAQAPHLCHSCVSDAGDPGPLMEAIEEHYADRCGVFLADETPWPNPADSSAPISLLNDVTFPANFGQLIYYNGHIGSNGNMAPFNKTVAVHYGQLTNGQCTNVIQRLKFGFQRRERYECEVGLRPAQKPINPQNNYNASQLADMGELCTSAVTASITGYQVPSAQCGYGNPCIPTTGAKIVYETDLADSYLALKRTYNSLRLVDGKTLFGTGWHTEYARHLVVPVASGPPYVFSIDDAGNAERFDRVGTSSVYRSSNETGSVLTKSVGGTWTLQDAASQIFGYTAEGSLLSKERAGQPESRVTLSYSSADIYDEGELLLPAGKLVSATDAKGRSLLFEHEYINLNASCATSAPGCKGWRLSSVILPSGEVITYEYGATGLLQTASTPDGVRRHYLYNESENICPNDNASACTGGVVPAGGFPMLLTGVAIEAPAPIGAGLTERFATYQYDYRGRVITSEHAGGAGRVELSYPSLAQATVTLPEGKVRIISIGIRAGLYPKPDGWVDTSTAGVVPSATFTYDSLGRLQAVEDALGVERTYQIDASGLRVGTVESAHGLPEQMREESDWDAVLGVVLERRTFDASAVLVAKSTWTYNTRGQVLTSTQTDTATLVTRTTTYAYCESADVALPNSTCPILGLPKSADGPRTDVADLTTYTYYPTTDESGCATTGPCHRKGDLWTVTNALGHTTETQRYDRAGRVRASLDPNGVVTEFTYHPRGWLTSRTVKGATTPEDATTTYTYDAVGQVTRITQPDGDFLDYDYDAAHRLVAIEDALGNRIDYTLDAAGNRTAETTSDASAVVKRQLTRVYDQLGRLDQQLDAQSRITDFAYDANGNQTGIEDALNVETKQDYDPLNRLKKTIQDYTGLDVETNYAYDALDRLVTVTDPKGLDTDYTYDGLGNLTELDSPDTGITSYTYDAAGNRLTQTDARGITATHTYDALNRLTATTYPTSSLNVTYLYDTYGVTKGCNRVGRLAATVDASGTTTYCYDRRGNLTQKSWTTAGKMLTTTYSYSKGDRLQGIRLPTGLALGYARNALNQITDIARTDTGSELPLVADATYLPFGPLQSLTFANGATQTFAHDQNYWTDGVSGTALSLDFTLDATGNIVAANDPAPASARLYTYDPLARLTDIDTGSATLIEAFTYDATGNRLSKQTGGGTQTYGYPASSHRLISIDAQARAYDAMGSLTTRGTDTFTHDDRQRLVAYGATATYGYNAKGERASKTVAGTTTHYVYDEAGHLIAELDPSTTPPTALRSYIWLDDRPVALYAHTGAYANQWLHIHTDHLGTPRAITRPAASNAIVWRWDFNGSAFGDHAPQTDPDGDATHFTFNLRFPGQYFDAESGLHYNYFRDYEADVGRYIESDPAGIQAAHSTYEYVGSDPLVWTDTLGLARNKLVERWSPCSLKDQEICQGICSPRAVESCKRRWILGTGIEGEEVVQGWVPKGLSCSCQENFCEKNPLVCAAAQAVGYGVIAGAAAACFVAGTLIGVTN